MKILQSTVERALYVALALFFVAVGIVGYGVYHEGQEIKELLNNHTAIIQREATQTSTIIANQKNNGTAIETFIRDGLACLFTQPQNLSPTNAQITTEVNNCFKTVPEVK